jgi:hypothetical protein
METRFQGAKPVKLSRFFMLPLVAIVIVTGTLLLMAPTAQSSNLYESDSVSDRSEASDRVIDRQTLGERQVFLFQTRSTGVELIPGAKVVVITQSSTVTVEDSDGEVIRVFQGMGRGADLVAIASVSEAEARQLLEGGGVIVDPLD